MEGFNLPYIMADNSLIIVGKTIRKLRDKKGISQELLAEEAGIHRTYMGRVERGNQNIAVFNLIQVAKALKVKPSVLLEEL